MTTPTDLREAIIYLGRLSLEYNRIRLANASRLEAEANPVVISPQEIIYKTHTVRVERNSRLEKNLIIHVTNPVTGKERTIVEPILTDPNTGEEYFAGYHPDD